MFSTFRKLIMSPSTGTNVHESLKMQTVSLAEEWAKNYKLTQLTDKVSVIWYSSKCISDVGDNARCRKSGKTFHTGTAAWRRNFVCLTAFKIIFYSKIFVHTFGVWSWVTSFLAIRSSVLIDSVTGSELFISTCFHYL